MPFRVSLSVCLLIAASASAHAERLPLKTYTTADGLAHNNVQRIVRDSRGFLWFCTFEGLSRFDGYSFVSFGVEQGLPSSVVNDLLETREGHYWVATEDGVCLFDPKGAAKPPMPKGAGEPVPAPAMFTAYYPGRDSRSRRVTSLLEDREGAIWCGTAGGLYRLDQENGQIRFRSINLGMPAGNEEYRHVNAIIQDKAGALWIGSNSGIYRLLDDGRAERYYEPHGLLDANINCLLEDREGRLWAGSRLGWLCRLISDPNPARAAIARIYTNKDGFPSQWISQLFQASDGSLWAASNRGLVSLIPAAGGKEFRFRAFAEPNGLTYRDVQSLAEDRNGNLWLGTTTAGAIRLAHSGITAFTAADGFQWAGSIFKDRTGDLFIVGGPSTDEYLINRFDGERFAPIRPGFPRGRQTWGWNQVMLNDHEGEWWLATMDGVFRFPRTGNPEQLVGTAPKATYTIRDGLADNAILRLFEDSRGDIWISCAGVHHGLSRWERATNTFYHYREEDGLPSLADSYPTSFCEDRGGNVWAGFSAGGGLVRYREGRFVRFEAAEGLPEGGIFNLFVDSVGRLWVPTTRGGVCRIDNPTEDHPAGRPYSAADGISSNDIKCVTEDEWGRIYFGTGRGIDRLDPASGRIRHYTTTDGALLGDILAAERGRDGALWFGFVTGLVRLVPEPDSPQRPPPILITGLRVAGDPYPVSALGQAEMGPLRLGPSKNNLQVDFVALGFGTGEDLKYQYKLEGGNEDWSPFTSQRTVNFASLAPGRYRLLVRAMGADGGLTETPASLSFKILPPLWQQWWFLALVAAAVGLLAYSLFRYRLRQLLEIERMRTRIAADLHDDIGSNLSQIAVWSEVARRKPPDARADQARGEPADVSPEPLERIAATARETASAMSDIVWAINPRRDYLGDLISRMRFFAGEAFDSRDIAWQLDAPQTNLGLNAGTRREVFLIFKECVNNIIRHADCTRVEAAITIEGSRLRLRIRDDGRGFDPRRPNDGHGLDSLRERARNLAGALDVVSAPGEGTTVELEMPLSQSRRLR